MCKLIQNHGHLQLALALLVNHMELLVHLRTLCSRWWRLQNSKVRLRGAKQSSWRKSCYTVVFKQTPNCRRATSGIEENPPFQSPPPVSRETTLTMHQYATPYSSSPSDPIRTHLHNQAEPWTKPLPPLSGQWPIQTTQPHFYNIPPTAVHPIHSP